MASFEEEWRRRFEMFAEDYEADSLISGWSESGLQQRLGLFVNLLKDRKRPPPAKILDLGCGAGTYVRALADLGYRVVGLDYSIPSLVRAVTADQRRAGQYSAGEAYSLPFRNESFDLVIAIGILQALLRPEYALDEVVRILRPGGVAIIEFLNAYGLVALIRSAGERLMRRLPRVRSYSPFIVSDWLTKRRIGSLRRDAVYLPPRNIRAVGRIFDNSGFKTVIEKIPRLSLFLAHAFLLSGVKENVK